MFFPTKKSLMDTLITPIKKTSSGKVIVEYAEVLFLPSEDGDPDKMWCQCLMISYLVPQTTSNN